MNEYLNWDIQQIKDYGIKLKTLIEQGQSYIRTMPNKTQEDILDIAWAVASITDALSTLEIIRNRYIQLTNNGTDNN